MGKIEQLVFCERAGMVFETLPRRRAFIILPAGLDDLRTVRQNFRDAPNTWPHDGDVARAVGIGIFAGDDDEFAGVRQLLRLNRRGDRAPALVRAAAAEPRLLRVGQQNR